MLRDFRASGVTGTREGGGARARVAQVLLLPMPREVGRDPAEKRADIGSTTSLRRSYLIRISPSIKADKLRRFKTLRSITMPC